MVNLTYNNTEFAHRPFFMKQTKLLAEEKFIEVYPPPQ